MKPDPTRNTRAARYRAATKQAGGAQINVRIGPEAAAVLARMRASGMTVREAVEAAFADSEAFRLAVSLQMTINADSDQPWISINGADGEEVGDFVEGPEVIGMEWCKATRSAIKRAAERLNPPAPAAPQASTSARAARSDRPS